MNPAFSVIFFTTLCGASQGMVCCLGLAVLCQFMPANDPLLVPALSVAAALAVGGLVASFFHLGHPERAWRAAMMWRTSWLSREVIVLPAFIASVVLWAGSVQAQSVSSIWPLLSMALAFLLWLCTGMIYACIRFVQEWAHPITVLNFALMGMASGLVGVATAALILGNPSLAHSLAPWALFITLLAWAGRLVALRRNDRLRPRSSLQSATGIAAASLTQMSMGMSAGAFNTREFFHHATQGHLGQVRFAALGLAFALPALCLALATVSAWTPWVLCACVCQTFGLLAERWYFFAQANHPQNLYYQRVS